MRFCLCIGAFVLALSATSIKTLAQPEVNLDYYLPKGASYNPAIPTPESVLGFQIGQWHVSHDQIVRYMELLDAASDRISLQVYGRTHEQRPLLLLTITHPDNHSRLEDIRRTHLKLSDPTQSAGVDISQEPVVIYMGYSVHGNEPSGGNASLLAAYYLAAAQGPEVDAMLRNAVILLDPCFNPDGFQRFSSWVNSNRPLTETSDPAAREFREPWPGSRTNHYWFDLNRDWMPAQQPELQARLRQYHNWKPNLLTDHHEMGTGSTFFFQPGVPSRQNPLTPQATFDLTEKIARYHASALDSIGSLYYSQEDYDDFYVGKGSTYPDLNGAVGILFEQASSRGHAQESPQGVLRFPFTIRNQVVTTFSSIRAAVALRADLLAHQRSFYKTALEEAAKDPVKGYLVTMSGDFEKDGKFLNLLRDHQHLDLMTKGEDFPTEILVPMNQSNYRLAKVLFEARTSFTDSIFYDISAWNLAYAFGYDVKEVRDMAALKGWQVYNPEPILYGASVYINMPAAFAMPWGVLNAPRVLYQWMEDRLLLRTITIPQPNGSRSLPSGSILLPSNLQPISADSLLVYINNKNPKDYFQLQQLKSGYNTAGLDLGSPSFLPLEKPVVAILVGEGVNANDAGELWHVLDQRVRMPVTLLPLERVANADLTRYTHIVLANGRFGALGKEGTAALKAWAEAGGTIVATGESVRWLVQAEIGKFKLKDNPTSKPKGPQPYAAQEGQEGAQVLGGAIFQTQIDTTHPLYYGYHQATLPVFRDHRTVLEVGESPYSTPSRYTAKPLLAGYSSAQNQTAIANTAAVQVGKVGRGRAIVILDNPCFRAFWYGTERIFLNAIFFGSTIRLGSTE